MFDNDQQEDDEWSGYTVSTEGVRLSSDGFYHCEGCDERLDPTERHGVDRGGRFPDSQWKCPSCEALYWISDRGPTPKYDLTEGAY